MADARRSRRSDRRFIYQGAEFMPLLMAAEREHQGRIAPAR
jgi:hypothetical protein